MEKDLTLALLLPSSTNVAEPERCRTIPWCGAGCCAPANAVCTLSPDEDLIRQILADGASGISHSQDLGPYMRAETDLISGL